MRVSQGAIERGSLWPVILATKPMSLGVATRVIAGLSALLWLVVLYLLGWLL